MTAYLCVVLSCSMWDLYKLTVIGGQACVCECVCVCVCVCARVLNKGDRTTNAPSPGEHLPQMRI